MRTTEKQSAMGSRGMVVTNHPLASAAGAEILAGGGNAIDAAVAALFTLTVVEPMMVGILGGGFAHVRLPDGEHIVLEGQGRCPQATGPTTFTPDPSAAPGVLDSLGRRNSVGRASVTTPGNLLAWCELLTRYGSCSLNDVIEPAIRHASRGFTVSNFLSDCIGDCAADLLLDTEIASWLMPKGEALRVGDRLRNVAYAETLRAIASAGPTLLYGGELGKIFADDIQRHGGYLTLSDLQSYRTNDLEVLRSGYRGFEITGPTPPCSGPLHIAQMLNILEGFDIAGAGFGSAQNVHWLAEVLKIAFADRAASTADPDFVRVPVEKLLSADYADQRRAQIDPARAQSWSAAVASTESANTTHLTVADHEGRIVCATQTINSLFGARYLVPGTGMIPNNYMHVFDPHPGRANSVAAGKRVTSSMSPLIILKDGKPRFALGLPGGLRIFPSALQATINLIDHRMSLQEAVEAPRVWTQGYALELEPAASDALAEDLQSRGHDVLRVPNVGGGMCAIAFGEDGQMQGAACWRADGTAVGLSGGPARKGVRFLPEAQRRAPNA